MIGPQVKSALEGSLGFPRLSQKPGIKLFTSLFHRVCDIFSSTLSLTRSFISSSIQEILRDELYTGPVIKEPTVQDMILNAVWLRKGEKGVGGEQCAQQVGLIRVHWRTIHDSTILNIYALLVNRNLSYVLGGMGSKKAENYWCSKQMITRQSNEPQGKGEHRTVRAQRESGQASWWK